MTTIRDALTRRRPARVGALAGVTRRPARLVAAAVALLAAAPPPSAGAEEWAAPVPGSVARAFDLGANPFEGGRHRGADFGARAGARVRAACGGRVLVAGRVGTSGRVVTIGCGPWRVTHLPLGDVAVRVGAVVGRGTRIGTASPSRKHDGLHLGVRRDGDRFGYVDPLRFLPRASLPPPPLGAIPPRGSRPPPRAPTTSPELGPRPVGVPTTRPGLDPRPVGAAPGVTREWPAGAGSSPGRPGGAARLAPWPAWAGLALLLAGAVGAGVSRRPRRRRAGLPGAAAQEVR